MCNSLCIFNSINKKIFLKYSKVLNFSLALFNTSIIIVTLLCFISCNLDLIIITGYTNYINNIFFGLIMLSIIMLIVFYIYKQNFVNEKKQTSIILATICLCIVLIKIFSSLVIIGKLRSRFELIKKIEFASKKSYKESLNQSKLLLIYILIIFGLYIITGIFWLFYIVLIYNLRVVILNDERNNINIYNRNNLSYLSTKTDLGDNSREVIINNLSKENNFYYFSDNIINKVQKDYEDKEIQTNIKGLVK